MSAVTWSVQPFAELDITTLHDILKLRVDVFVVEQRCPYAEVDGADTTAVHVMGRDTHGTLVAYARILPADAHGLPHIGRVVVHPAHRGKDLGRALMHTCFNELERIHGTRRNAISAQAHLKELYASLGYRTTGPEYVWDGIPHVDMELT